MSDPVPGPVPATATQAAAHALRRLERAKAYGVMTADEIGAAVLEAAWPLLHEHAAATERAAIQAHLRDVVTDHVPQGNDYVLGALLEAIRELVPLCGAESHADASGNTTTDEGNDPR
jgi:hypothetical protein